MSDINALGPNMKSLLFRKVALDAIPPGGGFDSGVEAIMNTGKLARLHREAFVWVKEVVEVVKSAPDNPYGDDEEAIAGAILEKLAEQVLKMRASDVD